jgi:hypothetical protein
MKMKLVGFERITPKAKAPFTNLYTEFEKHGVEGLATDSIYVADGFPLPALRKDMTLDVDRDGRGYLIAVSETPPLTTTAPKV